MPIPHYAIAVIIFILIFFIGIPYYIYRLIKGIMTHNAELKYKYSQKNNQNTENRNENVDL